MLDRKSVLKRERPDSSEKVDVGECGAGKIRTLSSVMSRNLRMVGEHASVGDALKLMRENSIRHVLVVEEGTNCLKGVLSDRDVRAILSPFVGTSQAEDRDNATLGIQVNGIMKRPALVAKPDDSLRKAAELMLQKRVGCIPVVDDNNRPVGIVTTKDLLRELLNFLP